jgi:hypothetical protein
VRFRDGAVVSDEPVLHAAPANTETSNVSPPMEVMI